MHVHGPDARLALHLAAPLELAMAPLLHGALDGVVPPSAAQQVAAVDVGRSAVAGPALRAQRAHGVVTHAVVGGVLQVHQVVGRGDADLGVAQLQAAASVHADLRGAVVLVAEVVACNKKVMDDSLPLREI